MVGDGAAVLVRRALTAAGVPIHESSLPRFLELYDERLLRTTRPYSGILEALQAVQPRGVLAVLTNKPLGHTLKLLSALELAPFFAKVVGGDGPHPRKPDPQGLQHLMRQHHARPQRTILVGDSHIDAATAYAAGARFCWARYGFGALDALTAAAVVDAPKDLPAAILALLG